ncbi:uncharacterized protein N7477_009515 [Penicillium maclennaniae]|uniref:uncharacterized protein n=1 Tax=Penicillium maclennaniae TaxID=1343394 RepID=UPI0025419945|nr:uncharacterized protein N7477_009515 [Penicillium maclennaniae]KAJ5661899.1 hypothetical protein N7477_009515 [Penicillium maclennaniae]
MPITPKKQTILPTWSKRSLEKIYQRPETFIQYISRRRNLSVCKGWQKFSRPADIHSHAKWQAICESWNSLFFYFLRARGYLASQVSLPEMKPVPWFDQEDFQEGFRAWLKDVKAAGLDLERLGAIEWCIWKNESTQREFNGGLHRVTRIAYGPLPEDWGIWLSEPSDPFARDFWALVARPAEIMPGGWPGE